MTDPAMSLGKIVTIRAYGYGDKPVKKLHSYPVASVLLENGVTAAVSTWWVEFEDGSMSLGAMNSEDRKTLVPLTLTRSDKQVNEA